jgi:hypothetical protein
MYRVVIVETTEGQIVISMQDLGWILSLSPLNQHGIILEIRLSGQGILPSHIVLELEKYIGKVFSDFLASYVDVLSLYRVDSTEIAVVRGVDGNYYSLQTGQQTEAPQIGGEILFVPVLDRYDAFVIRHDEGFSCLTVSRYGIVSQMIGHPNQIVKEFEQINFPRSLRPFENIINLALAAPNMIASTRLRMCKDEQLIRFGILPSGFYEIYFIRESKVPYIRESLGFRDLNTMVIHLDLPPGRIVYVPFDTTEEDLLVTTRGGKAHLVQVISDQQVVLNLNIVSEEEDNRILQVYPLNGSEKLAKMLRRRGIFSLDPEEPGLFRRSLERLLSNLYELPVSELSVLNGAEKIDFSELLALNGILEAPLHAQPYAGDQRCVFRTTPDQGKFFSICTPDEFNDLETRK